MIISYVVDDMSATHTDDLHVSTVFLCLQFRFIPVYFIRDWRVRQFCEYLALIDVTIVIYYWPFHAEQ